MSNRLFNWDLKPATKFIKKVKVGEYSDGTPISLLVRVIKGTNEGPTLSMLGVQHGDEYNGMEIINRFMEQLEPQDISGTVIGIPVSNPLAFNAAGRMAPESMGWEELNMNRIWPGNPRGLLTERIVASIWKNVITESNCILDFHEGGKCYLARYIWVPHNDDTDKIVGNQVEKIYGFFGQGIPVNAKPHSMTSPMRGCLEIQAGLHNIPCIAPELGGGHRIWEELVQDGINGARNVMIGLGMLQGEPVGQEKKQLVATEAFSPRTLHGGICYNSCELNAIVNKDATLGIVKDIAGREIEKIHAPYKSVLFDIRHQPIVHSGDWLYACGKIS